MALPPTVTEEMKPAITALRSAFSKPGLAISILKTIAAPMAPLIIPQMSPITSLQKLDTLSAFFKRSTASLAPFILFAAIEFIGTSEHAVIATPIMSNKTPIEIIITSITSATAIFALINKVSEIKLNMIAKRKVQK